MQKSIKIAFIIITYNEVFYETITYKTLINSISASHYSKYRIFIYDNSDKPRWNVNYHLIERKEKIHYHHDKNNSGISVAYNKMAVEADNWGAEWIVLFDQDTTLPPNIVPQYINAIVENPEIVLKIPILYIDKKIFSPMRLLFMRSIQLKEPLKESYSLSKYAFVNSGLMIHLPFFKNAGGYNEKIKLDFADFQFIEKAKKYTNKFEVLSIKCLQNFSHSEKNLAKAFQRYTIYIKDLSNCETESPIDTFAYNFAGLLHTVKLTCIFKTFRFINFYFSHR